MVLLETDLGPGVCFPEGTLVSGCRIPETFSAVHTGSVSKSIFC